MGMKMLRYQKELEVRHRPDVLVVGGGPAGCAAAWAAARGGAKVLLLEGQSCLGGLGTAGLVPAFMQFGDGVNFLAAGFGSLLFRRLEEMGARQGTPQLAWEIRAENLKRVYEDLLSEQGVPFILHTQLIDVLTEGDAVKAAVFAAKTGVFAVEARVYVDATGDADLCAWAGVPTEKGDENGDMMAGTLCQLWANIDWSRAGNQREPLERAIADGVFPLADKHLPGIWKISENGVGGGNIGHAYAVDGTDEVSLTRALVYSRRLVDAYRTYYQRYVPGFERMELIATGSMMGIRESRRIVGEDKLILDAFLSRAVFPDEIGRYAYPVDAHAAHPTDESYEKFHREHMSLRYRDGESYGIPYGILLPKGLRNALAAGRCVSSDRQMQSSIRVMPGCYITGQAAGVAAALAAAAAASPLDLDVRAVQRGITDLGGYLPNFMG